MNNGDNILNKIQRLWDQQNQIFEQTPFITEEDFRKMMEPSSDTKFHQRMVRCRKHLCHTIAATIILTAIVLTIKRIEHPLLSIILYTSLGLAGIATTWTVYKLYLYYRLDSNRIRLSKMSRMSHRLKQMEDIVPPSIVLFHSPAFRTGRHTLSVRTATAAACILSITICLLWYHRGSSIHESGNTMAMMNDSDQSSARYKPNPSSATINNSRLSYPNHTSIGNDPTPSRQVPIGDNDSSTQQNHTDPASIVTKPRRTTMLSATSLEDSFYDDDIPADTHTASFMLVLCNQEECSGDIYNKLFQETINGYY